MTFNQTRSRGGIDLCAYNEPTSQGERVRWPPAPLPRRVLESAVSNAGPMPPRRPWRAGWGAGAGFGYPLGGDGRGAAWISAPLDAPWQAKVGVDASAAVPLPLGDGVVWSFSAVGCARGGVTLMEVDGLSLSPFLIIGAGL